MTAPIIDPFGAKRRRRMALSSDAPDFTLDDSRVRQALDFGDQTDAVDRMMLPPEQERPATFLGRLGKALPDALGHGLASIDPETDSGFGQFLGEAGRGYVDARGRQTAEEEDRRQREIAAFKLKGDMFDRAEGVRQFDTSSGIQRQRLRFDMQPDYQKQGYGSLEEQNNVLHPAPTHYESGRAPGATTEDTFEIRPGEAPRPLGIIPRPDQPRAGTSGNSPRSVSQLRREFTSFVKPYEGLAQAFRKINGAASDPSAAGDLSVIFGYMKLLDPPSVVREGEQATATNAAGVPDRIRAAYNKAVNGERLAPNQRADFVRQANNLLRSQSSALKTQMARYGAIAEANDIDPEQVVYDPFGGIDIGDPDAKPTKAERIAQLKESGVSREQAIQSLRDEGYTVP